ncbi:MAG TPA: hypothetical protein VNI20_13745, partial [Fimbriimonadaceae bacterium]|nr:hypothetical protein [Fimbriimonadaceae bacterium]
MPMHYLTVQDMLAISLEITKERQRFDYATLEEAVFYQYASGDSTDLAAQGARFINGFKRLAPFAEGNGTCAFVGLVAFLEANAKTLDLTPDEARAWIAGESVTKGQIEGKMRDGHVHTKYGV